MINVLDWKPSIENYINGGHHLNQSIEKFPIELEYDHNFSYWSSTDKLIIGVNAFRYSRETIIWRLTHELSHLAQASRKNSKRVNLGLGKITNQSIDKAYLIEQEVAAFQAEFLKKIDLFSIVKIHNAISLNLRSYGKEKIRLTDLAKEVKVDYDQMLSTLNQRLTL
jgi:coproporphyrinogen III oxidase-like Fe-S oxidoreductase